jgi:translation initiation factor IF-3
MPQAKLRLYKEASPSKMSTCRKLALTLLVASATSASAFRCLPSMQRPVTTALSARRAPGGKRYQPRVEEDRPTMNADIQQTELRIVMGSTTGAKDEPIGVMTKVDALAKAKELSMDLILINDQSDPPVCKIVDYSKWRYSKEKKAKEVKKNSKATEIKEIKMSYKIDVHDYDVRKKNCAKFLNQGNRVKCTVMFRGREVQHDNLGFDLLDKLANDLDKFATKEGRPKREGRSLAFILTPRPEVVKALLDAKRAEEKAKKKKREETFKALQQAVADATGKGEVEAAIAAIARAEAEEAAELLALSLSEEEEDDDDDDVNFDEDDDDDDVDVESSLDALLGSDDLTDDLFS